MCAQTRRPRLVTVQKYLGDPSPNTRRLGVGRLEHVGTPEAVELLIAALHDPDRYVRGEAADVLGRLRAAAAVPRLVERMAEPDPNHRRRVVVALTQIGVSIPIGALAPCLLDEDRDLRVAALAALDRLCPDWTHSPDILARVPQALQNLGDRSAHRRAAAAVLLGRVRASEAVAPLQRLLRNPSESIHEEAKEALARIADPNFIPDPPPQPLAPAVVQAWWTRLEQSGWLADVPPAEAQRIRTQLEAFEGRETEAFNVLASAWIDAESIENDGDYRKWVIASYRSASFGAFTPQNVKDHLDTRNGMVQIRFQAGGTTFERELVQDGDYVADGFHDFMNEVLAALGETRRFYELPSDGQLSAIVCVRPETYERARALGLIPQ